MNLHLSDNSMGGKALAVKTQVPVGVAWRRRFFSQSPVWIGLRCPGILVCGSPTPHAWCVPIACKHETM